MSLIQFEHVSKTYGTGESAVRALDEVDLTIEEGRLTVVLGPSGSGKSTALNLLGGMDRCTSGAMTFRGRDISGLSDDQLARYRRDEIGFVFQFYNLIGNLTAAENVGIGCQFAADPIDPVEALALVGMEHRTRNLPGELSGGEMQRVAIARALAKRPRMLLCDEPTGALDSTTGRLVLEVIARTARAQGTAVVIVTHNAGIAPAADTVIRLHDGQVLSTEHSEVPVPVAEVTW